MAAAAGWRRTHTCGALRVEHVGQDVVLNGWVHARRNHGGIYFLEASFAAKGFYSMSALMLVHTTVSITKTLRDREESQRLHNRIEDAKTEKLLKEVGENIAA